MSDTGKNLSTAGNACIDYRRVSVDNASMIESTRKEYSRVVAILQHNVFISVAAAAKNEM